MKVVATNRKALHDYEIAERFEAGIVLTGDEIKSIRAGHANIREAYAAVEEDGVYIHGMHIAPYSFSSVPSTDPTRSRKLLLHGKEIKHLIGKVKERGYTLIPLRLYIKDGWAKVEIGLAKGKKKYDKRREMAKREAEREVARATLTKGARKR